MFPARFNNKTNGVTPRRWLMMANPDLAALLTEAVGDTWITDLNRLARCAASPAIPAFETASGRQSRRPSLAWRPGSSAS